MFWTCAISQGIVIAEPPSWSCVFHVSLMQ
jgi:hypothetical protein